MTSVFNEAYRKNKVGQIEPFIAENLIYETRIGSNAYGCSQNSSDTDIYGITVPPKSYILPHTGGYIPDFDDYPYFGNYQRHHVKMDDAKEYDFDIYGILKFLKLAEKSNPNQIDALFAPQTCVTHCTDVGRIIRESRHVFLSKEYKRRTMGYAYSQIKKLENPGQGDRSDLVEKYGWDVKFGYHCVRLVTQCEQVLKNCDLDLRKYNDMFKSIRNGEWSKDDIQKWFNDKESHIDELERQSDLPNKVDHSKVKGLLVDCLRSFFDNLDDDFVDESVYRRKLAEIKKIVSDV
jgi:predicted nucleotidyltransferase